MIFMCGFDEAVHMRAKKIVIYYGGKVSDTYSKLVTCAVVERVGATGYKDLVDSKVRTVSLRWLHDCTGDGTLAPVKSINIGSEFSTV